MYIKNKYNRSTEYTLTWDTLYASARRDPIGSYIDKDVRKNNPENIRPISVLCCYYINMGCTG